MKFIPYKFYSNILRATMFEDLMNVYREVEVTNPDGSTDNIYSDEPVLVDVPCRISFPYRESPLDQEIDRNPMQLAPVLFCHYDVPLIDADYVVVTRTDADGNLMATYHGTISLINNYPSHKEYLFSERKNG